MNRKPRWLTYLLAAVIAVTPFSPIMASSGGTQPIGSPLFSDMKGHWAESRIEKWTSQRVVSGYPDNAFHPDEKITRAEFVTLLNKLFGFYVKSEQHFSDVDAGSWYADQLSLARQAGYFDGYPGNKAQANDYLTRQDAVTLLTRVFSLNPSRKDSNTTEFKDADEIAAYARSSVNALAKWIDGYEDGTFRPRGTITRAETVKLIDSLVSSFYNKEGDIEGGIIDGNVVINKEGVVLKNARILGNLYLAAGIGNGEVTLQGTKVKGITFVEGGGPNTIIFNDSELDEVYVNRKEGEVRVLASGDTQISQITVDKSSKLELSSGTKVDSVQLNKPTILTVAEGAEIKAMDVAAAASGTSISSRGTIVKANIEAEGVTINGTAVPAGQLTVTKGEVKPFQPNPTQMPAQSSGSSSSTETSVRSVDLADARATAETRSLFAYLNDVRGREILFGQQHATTEGISITAKDGTQSDVMNAVGDFPGMFGWDTLSLEGYEKPGMVGASQQQNRDNLIAVMKSAYEKGGVLTLSSHMPNFVTGGSFYDTKGMVISHILPGGDKQAQYNQFLDMVADFANNLKDDNGKLIPVIFRPFHEQNGGWFWWGAPYRTKDQYKEIYRYTVEYLRDKKGVHNFLYAFSPGSPFNETNDVYLETYPGDDYVDILGFDTYYDGKTPGWFDAVVKDAKLISKLADSKGKAAAFTEFGYSNVKPTGTQDLQFFTKLLNALKSDPDSRRMAYMLTWANFNTDSIFVPYKNAPGLGDHELLPNFTAYYNDPYTAFSKEVKADQPYSRQVITTGERPFLHITSPTANETIPATRSTTIRARVLNQNVERVTFRIGENGMETGMKADEEGFYYTADWTPGPSLDEKGTSLTVTSYAKDGSKLSQTIRVFISDVPPNSDPHVVDTFETYMGSNDLLDAAYSAQGDLNTITLDADHKYNGKYGLKLAYNVNGQGYTGEVKNMNNVDWSDANKLKFWLQPDGSGQKLVIQVNASGISFEAYPSLASTTEGVVEIPFSQFTPAPWDTSNAGKVMTKENLKDIRSFGIYVNKKETASSTTGTLYFDDIQVYNDGTGGVPDGGTGSMPAPAGLLYGFESDTQGWNVDVNNASAGTSSVTHDVYAQGSGSLKVDFSLSGSDFEIVKFENIDLSGVNELSAKLKLKSGTAKARLYIKAGPNWTWTDSGMVDINADDFTNVMIPLAGIANLSNVKAIGIKLEQFSGSGITSVYLDDVRLVASTASQSTVYGFEDGTLQGFSINVDNNNQYNTAEASGLAVTDSVFAASGMHAVKADFALNGGQFQLRRMATVNLSNFTKISVKVKVVPGEGATVGSGVKVQLFMQSGAGWETWTASNATPVDAGGYSTIDVNINSVTNRNLTQAIGVQVMTAADSSGKATVYVDDVTIS
ncbi:glycosyl hydrolase [Gordoniibacillus kamchatkensis]|uniref:glycosyl hydrolase n=1 Tax=Gordoniibacillus kamchatkensis TaxID=1590651 RepID=UPI0009E48807|nr:glycosyl hydrolase [Paenibacillus sp. VKM B-2647]